MPQVLGDAEPLTYSKHADRPISSRPHDRPREEVSVIRVPVGPDQPDLGLSSLIRRFVRDVLGRERYRLIAQTDEIAISVLISS
jgi:hypothetical protein